MGKNYSSLSRDAIAFAKKLKDDGIGRIDAYAYTDQKFGLMRGSTASHFGKNGAKVTNRKKKTKKGLL